VIRSEQLLGLVIGIDNSGRSFIESTGTVLASNSTIYNNAGWILSSTDSYGLVTEYVYNVFGETTQIRRELPNNSGWLVSETVYDSQGRVTFSTDSHLEGSTELVYGTKQLYDSQGRSVGSVRYIGSNVTIAADGTSSLLTSGAELYRTATEYDSKGRVKSSTDAYRNTTTYEYDKLDRQTAVNQLATGLRSETFYNAQGQVEKTVSNIKIKADGTYDTSDSITTLNTYNSSGQVIRTETDGRIVEYEYDNFGRQTAANDHLVTIDGQVVRHRSEMVYDELGRVSISITNIKQFADGTIDKSNAQEQKYEYDVHGNVVKTIFADGSEISAAYNEQGQKVSETNQLGKTRCFEYDVKGRLIAVVLPAVMDTKNGQMVSPRYDYQYDDFGRQTLIRDPNGVETRFEYDAFGNQISRTLPLGFGADGIQGTADDSVLPEGDFTERSIYDDSGRLYMQISFEGVVTTFVYDNLGRIKQKLFWSNLTEYGGGIKPPQQVWTYKYDSQGRETSVDQNGRKTETTYEQGRVASIKTPEGTVSYEYDKFGRQTRVYSDKGDDIRYEYDILGRLSTATDANTGVVTRYEYDLVGNLAKTTTQTNSSTKLVATYKYDNMNRLITLTNYVDKNNNDIMDDGEGVSQFTYTLDAQGKKTRADETFWVDGTAKENHIDWQYDDAGRLITEVFNHYDNELDQTLRFEYDLVGNRLSQTVDKYNDNMIDQAFAYFYDANDRLIEEWYDGQNDYEFEKKTRYGYDHTQQTSKTVIEEGVKTTQTTFEYNLLGRMSVVTIATYGEDGTTIIKQERTTYEYGENGIRTSALYEVAGEDGEFKVVSRTEYLNDSRSLTGYSQVLRQTEYDADGNIVKETSYVIGHQRISQTVKVSGEETTQFFTFDGHGSTRVLLDVVGAIAQLYAFDAYGNAIGFNPAEAMTEFLYSGEQFDAKIGQQYLRARYYDPATGRFNRLDPFFGNINDPQSFHKYLYSHADPISNFDPSGTNAVMAVLASIVGGFAGAIVGGYSGYVQGIASYGLDGMEDNSANISAILWAIVGAAAGSAPGFYLSRQYGAAGFGAGALQGALDAALGKADPIDAAIEGLASAIVWKGVGDVAQLLTVQGGLICKLATKFPLAASALGSVVAGAGIVSGASSAYQAHQNGNDLQAALRGIFTVVDIVAIAKTIKLCFVEETPVLQYEGVSFEPIIAMAGAVATEEISHSETTSHMPYVAASLIAVLFFGSRALSIKNNVSKRDNKKILQELYRKFGIIEN
jgi:RHS repeat-associated protein